MVMFSTWQRTAWDQKRNSVMQMTSEDPELRALSQDLEGYLGKVQERTSLLENCPWCCAKGWVHALRSYPINLQESITLCTNPQCLYPLVSRPLEDVLADLIPVKAQVGVKRKNGQVLPSEDVAIPPPKRPRSHGDEQGSEASDSSVTGEEPPAIDVDGTAFTVLQDACEEALWKTPPSEGPLASEAVCQGEGAMDQGDDVLVPTCSPSKPTPGESALSSADPLSSVGGFGTFGPPSAGFAPRRASVVEDGTPGGVLFGQANGQPRDGLGPCDLDSTQGGEPFEGLVECLLASAPAEEPRLLDGEGTSVLTGDATKEAEAEAAAPTWEQADAKKSLGDVPPRRTHAAPPEEEEGLVSLPARLFWKNNDKLCWLDALLVALVNCRSLRDNGPGEGAPGSPIWELITEYDAACAAAQAHQLTGRDGVVRVPDGVLKKAHTDLHRIRMAVFQLLQPKLRCRLGRKETPVFALPLLVAGDPWAEGLFEQSFEWELECSSCQSVSHTRVTKPLPTFTNVVDDWHPEKAAHRGPCNLCHQKDQRRTMVLDRVPAVFALHFVDGLPGNDPQSYSFSRGGRRYVVSTVIQYDRDIQHFVTWTRTVDGAWQEFDDLKHPGCRSHQELPVPAQEMHIVFWEADEDPARPACSPSAPVVGPPPSNGPGDEPDQVTLLAPSPDRPLLPSYDDGDLDCALDLSVDGGAARCHTGDASIGSATLLDAFEGLSHSDIVTLTLTEVRPDSEGKLPAHPTPERGSPDDAVADLTPRRDEALAGSASESESDENVSRDPTFDPPSPKRTRKAKAKAKAKREKKSGTKPKPSPKVKAPPKPKPPPKVKAPPKTPISKRGKKVFATAVAMETAATAGVPSTNPSPPPPPPVQIPALDNPLQQDRWSFMMSKQPQTRLKAAPAPATTPAAAAPVRPAPNPAPPRKPSAPRPQLRLESSELPPKNAGMYDAFGVKRRSPSSSWSPAPPTLPEPAGYRTPSALPPSTPTAAKVVAFTFQTPGATELPRTAPSGKRDRLSDGPVTTDTLRLQLLKKLKAKKKKLEALNQLLQGGAGGGAQAGARAGAASPQAVTSSTAPGSSCEDLLTAWLSPTSTVSNRSPDSSGLPETRTNGSGAGPVGGAYQTNYPPTYCLPGGEDNLLEEFMSGGAALQRQAPMEAQGPSGLAGGGGGGKKACAVSNEFETFDMDDLYLF
ncbi:SUMO-specific isopeptidase USPL1 isoform X2 [Gadus chalcogrammus]|uniref:SUMO-specific isopeptidase USPL1 isoform X2 n=1 Tax=Gadus chalcogrammus TaxID=1042646 RepID=UPI0024C218C8|nr:SUMO-specific isopeptidase USPL1 isoform X2 [Gadus chalcogrammus]